MKLKPFFFALAALFVLMPLSGFCGEDMKPGEGVVREIKGVAKYDSGKGDWKPLRKCGHIGPGGTIATGAGAMVDISLGINGAVLRLTPETTVKFEQLDFRGSGKYSIIRTKLTLVEGRILGSAVLFGDESRYEIKTPTGFSGLRGKESVYDISARKTSAGNYESIYICLKGTVVGGEAFAIDNTFVLEPGQGASGLEIKPAKDFHLPSFSLPRHSAW